MNLQDWEINEVLSLLHTLDECNLDEQTRDRLRGNTKEGNYTVKESYIFGVHGMASLMFFPGNASGGQENL